MQKDEKNSEEIPPPTRDVLLYKPTIEDKIEEIKSENNLHLFTEEQRQKGNEKSAETNRAKGAMTDSLNTIAKEFQRIASILDDTEQYKDKALRLYAISKFIQYRGKMLDALIDLATGACIGVTDDPEDSKKKIRVYSEKPSIIAFQIFERLMRIKEENAKTRKSKSDDTPAGTSTFEETMDKMKDDD